MNDVIMTLDEVAEYLKIKKKHYITLSSKENSRVLRLAVPGGLKEKILICGLRSGSEIHHTDEKIDVGTSLFLG